MVTVLNEEMLLAESKYPECKAKAQIELPKTILVIDQVAEKCTFKTTIGSNNNNNCTKDVADVNMCHV